MLKEKTRFIIVSPNIHKMSDEYQHKEKTLNGNMILQANVVSILNLDIPKRKKT